jgi:beta-aspartyl-peptidase (threonine type)
VLCADGSVELSASLMRGSDRAAGAVAAVGRTRNPIAGALAVLRSDQVLMVGEAADRRAAADGAEQVDPEYFVTDRQRERLARQLGDSDHATVGAVCVDGRGRLAAATSTGGIRAQPPGRVGDSPLIGAGTWADTRVAVSCTGDGEVFIRAGVGRYIGALVEQGMPLDRACEHALDQVKEIGGAGGLVAVDAHGAAALPFLTAVMPRGIWRAGGEPLVWVGESAAASVAV